MARNENYNYYKSELLGVEYAIAKDRQRDSRVCFSDGVIYQWHEILKIKGMDNEKIKRVHELKKEYPAYTIDEILTVLECSDLEIEYLDIVRDTFNGKIKAATET